VPERGGVGPFPQPVPSRFGLHPPAERQLNGRGQLGYHDRAIPDGWTHHRVAPAAQRVEQRRKLLGIHDYSLVRRLARWVITGMHDTVPALGAGWPPAVPVSA
jgi:hypothetical protein